MELRIPSEYPDLINANPTLNIRLKMRIYTCTPADFKGDESFFTGDLDLLCRDLQKISVNSQGGLPGDLRESGWHDLIRFPYFLLQATDLWKSQKVEAVVFYSWGAPKFLRIARAIKKARIKLLIGLESAGFCSAYRNSPFLSRFFFLQVVDKHIFLREFFLAIFRCLELHFPCHNFCSQSTFRFNKLGHE